MIAVTNRGLCDISLEMCTSIRCVAKGNCAIQFFFIVSETYIAILMKNGKPLLNSIY